MHWIETTGLPTSTNTHHLVPERLKVARAEFQHMLELQLTTLMKLLVFALNLMPKPTQCDWRPCVDYH